MYSVSLPKDKRASFYLTEEEINVKVLPEDNDNVGVFLILNVLIVALIMIFIFSQVLTTSLIFIFIWLLFIYSFARRYSLGDREIIINKKSIVIKISNKVAPLVKKFSLDYHNYSDQIINASDVEEIDCTKLSDRIRGNLFEIFLILHSGLKVILCEVKEREFANDLIEKIKSKIDITK
jgi:hypothetical protein